MIKVEEVKAYSYGQRLFHTEEDATNAKIIQELYFFFRRFTPGHNDEFNDFLEKTLCKCIADDKKIKELIKIINQSESEGN